MCPCARLRARELRAVESPRSNPRSSAASAFRVVPFWFAVLVLPYWFPRLSAVQVAGGIAKPVLRSEATKDPARDIPLYGRTGIPRLRRCAAPLGMTCYHHLRRGPLDESCSQFMRELQTHSCQPGKPDSSGHEQEHAAPRIRNRRHPERHDTGEHAVRGPAALALLEEAIA